MAIHSKATLDIQQAPQASTSGIKEPFPEIEPYRTFNLPVSDIHTLYVEEVGNPMGKPIVFLHGGPGSAIHSQQRRLFNPQLYRAILFDQRGTGKSTPLGCIEHNTTWDLVEDLEKLRRHLDIDQWVVCGGSWGSTLALAYAQTHPNRVSALILRAIMLGRQAELDWLYRHGCNQLYPEAWEKFIGHLPENRRQDPINAYYELLTQGSRETQLEAAKAWGHWEISLSRFIPYDKIRFAGSLLKRMWTVARIESHYFVNHMFFNDENQLLTHINRIRHIPTHIIHGRYDMTCPVKNAWDLVQAFPEAHPHIIPNAGHAFSEPGILKSLLNTMETIGRT